MGTRPMTCSTCKFSDIAMDLNRKPVIAPDAPKICRRYPPLPMFLPDHRGQPGVRNVWPVMQPTDFCGEWKSKIEPAP